MIVEFVGLSGSGKTTVSRLAADLLAERGHGFSAGTLNRYGGNVRAQQIAAVMMQPRLAWLVRRCPRELALRMLRRSRMMASVPDNTLLDSGTVFAATGLLASVDPKALVAAMPLPGALVHLNLNPEMAAERVRSRNEPHAIMGMSDEDAVAYVGRRLGDFDTLLPLTGVPTVVVDASMRPHDVAHAAVEGLASFVA